MELVRILHGVAHEIAEAHEEAPRLAWLFGDEPGNGVQRVQEEVGLEVGPQAGDLGAAPKLLRFEGPKLRALDGGRVDEGERPHSEVELRVQGFRRAKTA